MVCELVGQPIQDVIIQVYPHKGRMTHFVKRSKSSWSLIAWAALSFTTYTRLNSHGISTTYKRINLPIIDTVQQAIPFAGQWTIKIYNYRKAERQSISKALKPKADL